MLTNDYLLANIGVDTAENEPSKVWTCLPAPCPPLIQLRMVVLAMSQPSNAWIRADASFILHSHVKARSPRYERRNPQEIDLSATRRDLAFVALSS